MPITQISKITHRKGLDENLPQLAGAELGWALDARKLYIGNGTITDGAPTVGNTEVLTQYSDILGIATSYTYKGTATGYEVISGPSASHPTTRSLQQKFDDFVSVRDFGAKGDGVTDDTTAINRALTELYTREVNHEIRRSLFFPAGTYKVTDTIKIPSYAKLYGEGAKSSTIKYYSPNNGATVASNVVKTTDSNNQSGVSTVTDIEISSMGFMSDENNDILYIDGVTNSSFVNMTIRGPKTAATILSTDVNACIKINGTALLVPENITFDNCVTSGTGTGMHIDIKCKGITLSNSKLSAHCKGVLLGQTPLNGGPTGVRITQNIFDDIMKQGIDIDTASMNISAFNTFYDVGNNFNGNGNPFTTIVDISNADNVSIGDMFTRPDADAVGNYARINLNELSSTAFDLSKKIMLGTYAREVGKVTTLTNGATANVFVVDLTNKHTDSNLGTFNMDYAIERNGTVRTGTLSVATDGGAPGTLTYNETYNENAVSGITFSVTQTGTDVSVNYTASNTGNNATLSYSLERLY